MLVDTRGRLHIDDELMQELEAMKKAYPPAETLFVADAMTGQDAVKSAGTFHEGLGLTGVILTKMDGDARGGAALSIRWVTGQPIKFIGTGEKYDALEPFHPERIAGRILRSEEHTPELQSPPQLLPSSPPRRSPDPPRGAPAQPIKFAGTGKKYEAPDPFPPERIAGRIL